MSKLGTIVQLTLVGAGGLLGSVLRYALSGFVQRMVPMAGFPYGTLAVNVVGCFCIGTLGGLAEARQMLGPEMRTFLLIGVLGGFTTFSTFGYEAFAMARDGEHMRAAASILLHVGLGLLAVWLGYSISSTR